MDVLVIDDDAISRLAVEHSLSNAGYSVYTVDNGQQALDRLENEHFQLVVCDWSMPGMDGLEICRTIRSGRFRRYVYIVMLTSHNQSHDTLEGLSAGADDYVTKPFNPAELVLRVNTGRRIIASESNAITIFSLAKLADSRDRETGAHLERVRSYCHLLATELRRRPNGGEAIDDEFVNLIYDTSPLHDIGKVAIPDSILRKPGKLSLEEYEVMKTHTLHGAQTLAAAMAEFPHVKYLRMAHDIALCHHEKFNGRGYPNGLEGKNIPLSARIVAIADVYDAITSKRVYKKAMSHAEAVAIIKAESGSHFDPNLADIFLALSDQFLAVKQKFDHLED